jgi:hypothetical protein
LARLNYFRFNIELTENLRAWLVGWGTVPFEAVVPFSAVADMHAPITDWVFAVDTRTKGEQATGAYYDEMRQCVAALHHKQTSW